MFKVQTADSRTSIVFTTKKGEYEIDEGVSEFPMS